MADFRRPRCEGPRSRCHPSAESSAFISKGDASNRRPATFPPLRGAVSPTEVIDELRKGSHPLVLTVGILESEGTQQDATKTRTEIREHCLGA